MTDWRVVYPGSGADDMDFMNIQLFQRRAAAWLARTISGEAGSLYKFTLANTATANQITVSDGLYISPPVQEVTAAIGSLPAGGDNVTPLFINSAATVVAGLVAPATAGQSINYLIVGTPTYTAANPEVVYYQNADNPAQTFRGVGNNGTAQPVSLLESLTLSSVAGVAAATGTQATPAVPAGSVAMYVVTRNYGDATMHVVQHPAAPFLDPLAVGRGIQPGRLIGIQVFTASTVYTPTQGTHGIIALVQGGGGGSGGSPGTGASSTLFGVAVGGAGAGGMAVSSLGSGFAGAAITIGAGGYAGGPGGAGGNGGSSSFGTLASAGGGNGGPTGSASGQSTAIPGGPGAGAAGGNLWNAPGNTGGVGNFTTGGSLTSGAGGSSPLFGAGGNPVGGGGGALGSPGNPGQGYGSGASGATSSSTAGAGSPGYSGAAGAAGVVVVLEFT